MPPSLVRARHRFFASPPSPGTAFGWLALGVAILMSAIVVTNIRPVSLRVGLDRVQGMGWMSLYSVTAAVTGVLALVLLRWPRKVTVTLAGALAVQFLLVAWMARH